MSSSSGNTPSSHPAGNTSNVLELGVLASAAKGAKQAALPKTVQEGGGLVVRRLKPYRAKNFIASIQFALEGLRYLCLSERNFRIDLLIACGVTILGLILGLSVQEWVLMVLVMGLVLTAEGMNTALEYTIDLCTQGRADRRAKIAKDVAAGVCLLAATCAFITGCLVFAPKLFHF